MRKLVGQVTEQEKNEVLFLHERRNGLLELSKGMSYENDNLYEKIVKDLGETTIKFQNWWDVSATKYNWERIETGHWEINFDNGDIFLCD